MSTAGASYESPRRISGAEYAREPQLVSRFTPGQNLFEKPKSVSFTCPRWGWVFDDDDCFVAHGGGEVGVVVDEEEEVVEEVDDDADFEQVGGKKTTFSGFKSRWATCSLWQ